MKEKIIALMEEIFQVPAGTVTEQTTADDLEEWDSLAHVMLIDALSSELGISIPLDEAVELASVAEIFEKAGL